MFNSIINIPNLYLFKKYEFEYTLFKIILNVSKEIDLKDK